MTSRISAAQDAPLFHPHHHDFPGADDDDDEAADDDDDERAREAADLLALQRSRRVAAASKLADSTESADDEIRLGKLGRGSRRWGPQSAEDSHPSGTAHPHRLSKEPELTAEGWGNMSDVGLSSHLLGPDDAPDPLLHPRQQEPGAAPATTDPRPPPPFQHFPLGQKRSEARAPLMLEPRPTSDASDEMEETDSSIRAGLLQQPGLSPGDTAVESGMDQLQPDSHLVEGELFRHDPFFAWIFLIALAGMLSTFFLVWLHTGPRRSPVGDTVYAVLQKSFDMLAVDTLVSVIVSLVWLAALRSFARPLVSLMLVALPLLMITFSLYSFASSFGGRTRGSSLQDVVLRWASLVPAAGALLWLWLMVRSRRAIGQSVQMLQFSSSILAQNPGLLLVGFGCLGLVVVWTWAWLAMFTRVFMGGYFSRSLVRFVIRASSWWLGAAFVWIYLWTLAVVNGLHRATTAATVSQWYFHRNAPSTAAAGALSRPPSREVVAAALGHGLTTVFGTICQSSLISLLVRIPLLLVPGRVGWLLRAAPATSCLPASVTGLANPLAISYAAIHSHPLAESARGLDQLGLLTATVSSSSSSSSPPSGLLGDGRRGRGGRPGPYLLAKLLLGATRIMMATGLGLAGWVVTAKQMPIALPDGMGVRGSAYAYLVGLVASFIGYSVMGAMEGVLGGILDAVLVCYATERRMDRGGAHGGFCLEAAYLFGEARG